jgi:hypothetical protein
MRRSPQLTPSGSAVGADKPRPELEKVSEQLERWLRGKTLGSLFELFEEKGFAILFVLLLGVSALPLADRRRHTRVPDRRRAARA